MADPTIIVRLNKTIMRCGSSPSHRYGYVDPPSGRRAEAVASVEADVCVESVVLVV